MAIPPNCIPISGSHLPPDSHSSQAPHKTQLFNWNWGLGNATAISHGGDAGASTFSTPKVTKSGPPPHMGLPVNFSAVGPQDSQEHIKGLFKEMQKTLQDLERQVDKVLKRGGGKGAHHGGHGGHPGGQGGHPGGNGGHPGGHHHSRGPKVTQYAPPPPPPFNYDAFANSNALYGNARALSESVRGSAFSHSAAYGGSAYSDAVSHAGNAEATAYSGPPPTRSALPPPNVNCQPSQAPHKTQLFNWDIGLGNSTAISYGGSAGASTFSSPTLTRSASPPPNVNCVPPHAPPRTKAGNVTIESADQEVPKFVDSWAQLPPYLHPTVQERNTLPPEHNTPTPEHNTPMPEHNTPTPEQFDNQAHPEWDYWWLKRDATDPSPTDPSPTDPSPTRSGVPPPNVNCQPAQAPHKTQFLNLNWGLGNSHAISYGGSAGASTFSSPTLTRAGVHPPLGPERIGDCIRIDP